MTEFDGHGFHHELNQAQRAALQELEKAGAWGAVVFRHQMENPPYASTVKVLSRRGLVSVGNNNSLRLTPLGMEYARGER